ncbi:metallophosphoesterase family protein [Corynebacterium otitidis]|uniref:metallophosphoesterase family protein n=1 Tax=Corynebacterium otitidis TaxID=29321 RepID=UPI000627557B|nr:metallophosphoesterase [Corynebacterium otitidis]KKO83724.1 hypothetical protein AAV33_04885 [Corynebacterium otitidis]
MVRTRFIHSSDLQLGMTRAFLKDDGQVRFADDRRSAITRLGELARKHGAEFIVLAGDVFDKPSVDDATWQRAAAALAALPVPTFIVPGNHDPLSADSLYRDEERRLPDPVRVLAGYEPVAVPGLDSVEVAGAPVPTKDPGRDLVAEALDHLGPTDSVRVLVGHGPVTDFGDHAAERIDIDRAERALDERVVDYVALGDTHSATRIGETGKIWYSGAPESTDFHRVDAGAAEGKGESNSGKALLVDVDKEPGRPADVAVEELEVGRWRLEELSAELNSAGDVERFLERLDGYPPERERVVVRYALSGALSLEERVRLDEGLARLAPRFSNLYPHERYMDLHTAPTEGEIDDLQITGFTRDALDELVERGEDGAVRLLVRLLAAERKES